MRAAAPGPTAGRWSRGARRATKAAERSPFGALAAAAATAVLAAPSARVGGAALTLAVFIATAVALRPLERSSAHLPVLRVLFPALVAGLAVVGLAGVDLATGIDGMDGLDWLVVLLAGGVAATLADYALRGTREARPSRVALVGGSLDARRLAADLAHTTAVRARLVGRIAAGGDNNARGGMPVIGSIGSLRAAILGARVDVLVLGTGEARLELFDELAETCLDLPVHVVELSRFYEDVFGEVPTTEINARWFLHLVDPQARRPNAAAKRAVDVVAATLIGVLAFPVVALLALLVKRDGGPAFFVQTRIGEGGRPFRLVKLRTMRVGSGAEAAWAADDDPRATRLGRLLRRSHLDELPQVWNVLRGEMSLVGPRPEQIPFVERLERTLPFYQRRHLIRPGLTGWAQVRCGYAGSDAGAAWKLCNDLYYVRHRSLGLDLLLLLETLGLLLFGWTSVKQPRRIPRTGLVLARPLPPSDDAEADAHVPVITVARFREERRAAAG